MTETRKITRDLGKHETWLINLSKRVDRENARHIEALNELEEERSTYLSALDADVRTKLTAMGVIGGAE